MKINKSSILTYNIFMLVPFLATIPLFFQLRKGRDNGACLLMSLLAGMLSFNYIPSYSNDKSRYIERGEYFSTLSLNEFTEYLIDSLKPDYIFDLINYLIVSNGLKDVKVFFFIITFITVYSVLIALKKIIIRATKRNFSYNLLTLFLVIMAISLPNLLSGMRFTFAGSFFLWFIYFSFFNKRYLLAAAFLVLSIATHFSYLLLTLAALFAFFKPKILVIKLMLAISLVFYIIPQDVLINITSALSLPIEYTSKVDAYTQLDNEFSREIIILSYLRNLWFYLAIPYLLVYKPKTDNVFFILIASMIVFINFMNPIPLAFDRYIVFFKILFAAYLVYETTHSKNKEKIFFIFMILFFLGWIVDIFVMRINLLESYSIVKMLTIFNIFSDIGSDHKILY